MELQDYLANRDAELSIQDLLSLKDDYISYYRGVLTDIASKFTYHLGQFVFFQEEFNIKFIGRHFELMLFLADEFRSEVEIFANSDELYNFFEIDKIIDEAFKAGDCSKLVEGKYKEEYESCKDLLTNNLSFHEYKSTLNQICRTDLAKEWLTKGEFDE